jgi:hypothetical protein
MRLFGYFFRKETFIINKLDNRRLILRDKSLKSIGINSNYRPDVVYYYPRKKHFVILEIDEKQHNGYCNTRELERYKDISLKLSCVGTVSWVRFNPDGYLSCGYKPDLEKRISMLKKELNELSTKRGGTTYMFYSNTNKHLSKNHNKCKYIV